MVPAEHPVHVHCYSDSLRHAQDLCKRWPNLRIGFTGAITFRDRGKGKGKDGMDNIAKDKAQVEAAQTKDCATVMLVAFMKQSCRNSRRESC